MFESAHCIAPDPILGIASAFHQDSSACRVDLTMGVYTDETGNAPIFEAVRQAEQRALAQQTTKTYKGIGGDEEFHQVQRQLLFGDDGLPLTDERVCTIQAPGGSGALRIAAELLNTLRPNSTVWVSAPTWANHAPILRAGGLRTEVYPYYSTHTGRVDFSAMQESLRALKRGAVVLLHGCCHNPSGADLAPNQWRELLQIFQERELVPLFDVAYQGFGEDLDSDAYGWREFARVLPEWLLTSSCSKSFTVYRERIGALTLASENPEHTRAVRSQLCAIVRRMYSTPPHHGAHIVKTLWAAPSLQAQWREELARARLRLMRTRRDLSDRLTALLKHHPASRSCRHIASQRGMFSLLDITGEHARTLRQQHHIYLVDNGRINVAGLHGRNLDYVADAIAKTILQG